MRLADTLAAELAQQAWWGNDAPGEITDFGIRVALDRTFGPTVALEDVIEWSTPSAYAMADADSLVSLRARFVGAISAALILGAKLQETNAT